MKRASPLSPELEALLAPHRTVSPLAPSVEARALARAARTAEWPDWGGGRVLGWSRWVFAAAAGAVIVLGAAAYAARAWIGVEPPERAAHGALSAPRTAGEPLPPPTVSSPPDTDAPVAGRLPAVPRMRRTVAKASPAAVHPSNAELQLLRTARQDVTSGDFSGALAVIAEHVRRFQNGALVEEREALRVKSLAGLGRHEEAQRAAARFRARFPDSVFLSTFERMQGADP